MERGNQLARRCQSWNAALNCSDHNGLGFWQSFAPRCHQSRNDPGRWETLNVLGVDLFGAAAPGGPFAYGPREPRNPWAFRRRLSSAALRQPASQSTLALASVHRVNFGAAGRQKPRADVSAHDLAAADHLSGFGAHWRQLQPAGCRLAIRYLGVRIRLAPNVSVKRGGPFLHPGRPGEAQPLFREPLPRSGVCRSHGGIGTIRGACRVLRANKA